MCKRMLSHLLLGSNIRILLTQVFYHEAPEVQAPFLYVAGRRRVFLRRPVGFMVFSWGVWASLPRYRSATPSGVKRRLLS